MPYRRVVFASNEIYHIVNRGVAQAPIFTSTVEYKRFLELINYYRYHNLSLSYSHFNRLSKEDKAKLIKNTKDKTLRLVEIYCYCLMQNHFHLLVKQLKDKGVPKVLAKLQNSYAKYFNLRHKRQGPLFQSMFKAVRVATDEQLLHVSRYIHLNPSTSFLVKIEKLDSYPWSSYPEYLGKRDPIFTNIEPILFLANGIKEYQKFVLCQAEYQRELARIKHLALEEV